MLSGRVEALRRGVPASRFARATAGAVRAGALSTGSINGMYPVDVELVVDVAMAAPGWQARLSHKDPGGAPRVAAVEAGQALVVRAAASARPVDGPWLTRLHETLCAAPPGQGSGYRAGDCQVALADGGVHSYPPGEAIGPLMESLAGQLGGEELAQGHPLVQAAYLHHSLVAIHPFNDGNGRLARALASLPLQRSMAVPLVVLPRQRQAHLDRLQRANLGQRYGLINFYQARVLDAAAATAAGLAASPSETRRRLRALVERSLP